MKVFDLSTGTSIQEGSTVKNENNSQRESAKWIAVLDYLSRQDMLPKQIEKVTFSVWTDAGYKFTEK